MAGELEGRTALVFGAGSVGAGWGNGKAAAVAYARAGARVVAVDLELDSARETAEIIAGEDGTCVALQGDVTDSSAIDGIVNHTLESFGSIDMTTPKASPLLLVHMNTHSRWICTSCSSSSSLSAHWVRSS